MSLNNLKTLWRKARELLRHTVLIITLQGAQLTLVFAQDEISISSQENSFCLAIPFPKELEQYKAYPWNIMEKDEELNNNYKKLIAQYLKDDDDWVRHNPPGITAQFFHHNIVGDVLGYFVCKAHWCNTNNMYVFFSPTTKKISITIKNAANSKTFGQLPKTLNAECIEKMGK